MLYLADIWRIGLFLVKNYHKIDLGFVLLLFLNILIVALLK